MLVTFRAVRDVALRAELAEREYRRLRVLADDERALICADCRVGAHRSPPDGSELCECSDRRCHCFVVPLHA